MLVERPPGKFTEVVETRNYWLIIVLHNYANKKQMKEVTDARVNKEVENPQITIENNTK